MEHPELIGSGRASAATAAFARVRVVLAVLPHAVGVGSALTPDDVATLARVRA